MNRQNLSSKKMTQCYFLDKRYNNSHNKQNVAKQLILSELVCLWNYTKGTSDIELAIVYFSNLSHLHNTIGNVDVAATLLNPTLGH